MAQAQIRVVDLRKTYTTGDVQVHALAGVSLDIEAGEFVAVMGSSGSGKSTLMNILGCLDRPTSGQYFLADREVSRLDKNELAEIRNRYLGFVFQNFNLLSRTSALENVELPLVYQGVGGRERKRRASAALDPVGEAVRLTAFGTGRDGHAANASRPSLAIADGTLIISFTVDRDQKRRITLLEVPLNDAELASGVKTEGKKKLEDRVVGKLTSVAGIRGQRGEARVVCDKADCFLVWDDDKGGAFAALFDRSKHQVIWHREFARSGSVPSISLGPSGAMIAYFDANRVKLASMTRDGVETVGSVAKVGGIQPYPAITPGTKPGHWYISWRDYESGHLEAYVARAECK